jgi:DNA-binding transcriptional ArsR family regulator
MEAADEIFHAIADASRRKLLDVLAEGDLPAQELANRFDISFAAVSQHLKVLREVGLVNRRAEGRQRIYSLAPARLQEVDDWTAHYRKFWRGRLSRLRSYLESAQTEAGEPKQGDNRKS